VRRGERLACIEQLRSAVIVIAPDTSSVTDDLQRGTASFIGRPPQAAHLGGGGDAAFFLTNVAINPVDAGLQSYR
jgi:hypothetical protein